MKVYLNETSLSVPGLPWGSASRWQTLFDLRIEILTLIKIKILPPKFPIFIVLGSNLPKNGYIPYESGILLCLLVIFWSLANEIYFFVVLNELICIQNPQFTKLRTTISKRMAIHCLIFNFWLKKDNFYLKKLFYFFLAI